ncbi:MAG TPA: DUF6491 family protein [Rhizomicrobium sp.]|nr:DUF6491 family protein [Rhizomicrobium sp.]
MRSIAPCAFAAAFLLAGSASAEPAAPTGKSCFFINQFETWKAPDDKTMYIRTSSKHYYRLDMAGSCSALTGINPHLVTTFRGTNSICSHLDWDLKVVRSPGSPPEACIVKAMTEMTPEEVKAIPKKFKP